MKVFVIRCLLATKLFVCFSSSDFFIFAYNAFGTKALVTKISRSFIFIDDSMVDGKGDLVKQCLWHLSILYSRDIRVDPLGHVAAKGVFSG